MIPTWVTVSQSTDSEPAHYKTSSFTCAHGKLIFIALANVQFLHKNNTQKMLQDFTNEKYSLRKPKVSGPIMSMPSTTEQQAIKKKAQQESENAASYPF